MSNSLVIDVPNVVKQNTPLRNVPSGSTAEPDYSVKYTPQTLTEEQKAQARQNIGAAAGEGGGATINEFVYREWEDGPTSGIIDCEGYEPKEGDLMIISFQGSFHSNDNQVTLNNGTTTPTVTLLNAEVNATDYDEINPEVNTKWTVRLTKVNDAWVAVNISTQVQADWNTSDSTMASYIKNKPVIGESFDWGLMNYSYMFGFQASSGTFDICQLPGNINPDTVVPFVVANYNKVLKRTSVDISGGRPEAMNDWEYGFYEAYGLWFCAAKVPSCIEDGNPRGDSSYNKWISFHLLIDNYDFARNLCDRGNLFKFEMPKLRWSGNVGFHYNDFKNTDTLIGQSRTLTCPHSFALNVGPYNIPVTTIVYLSMDRYYTLGNFGNSSMKTLICNNRYVPVDNNLTSNIGKSHITDVWVHRSCLSEWQTWAGEYASKLHPFDFLVFEDNGSVTPIALS